MENFENRLEKIENLMKRLAHEIATLRMDFEDTTPEDTTQKATETTPEDKNPLTVAGIEPEFQAFYLKRFWGGRPIEAFSEKMLKELKTIVSLNTYRPQVEIDENLISEFSDRLSHLPANDKVLKDDFIWFLGNRPFQKENLWAIIYIMRACRRRLLEAA